jgi:4-aminobutyrate aminotransferase
MSKYICRKPGKKSLAVINRDHKIISPSYGRESQFVFDKGKGMYAWDVDGKKYMDFSAGIAVNSIGHSNPEIIKSIKYQMGKGFHAAFADFYAELPVKFVENLLNFVPKNFNNAFLSNSGTEAVEAGLKLAKWHTKKKRLIAFNQGFHGRTMGALSMTNSQPVQRERFNPFLPVTHIKYPYNYRCVKHSDEEGCSNSCLDELEKVLKKSKDVAAVFMEPVQGEGGYIVPPKSFVKGVRKLTKEFNVLMCDDEIQAGCYRTGKFLAIEHFNVVPDIVCLSKAIGGGMPLGVTLANRNVMDWVPGSHSTTFGGNLLACSAGIATLNYMKKNNLGENARKIGNYMLSRLNEMKEKYEIIGDIRGLGLMIGVEFVKDKKSKKINREDRHKILCMTSDKGLLLLPAGQSVIRICPPLIINKNQADQGMDIFEDAVRDINK